MFHVINSKTGQVVAKCKTKGGARLSRDRKDNEYGAYVHRVVEVVA